MSKMFKLLAILLVISLLALPLVGCKALTLSVVAPIDRATITTSTVEVRGTVSDAKATVWVNDSIIAVSKKGYFSTEVTLTSGENAIEIVAARGKAGKWKNVIGRTVTVTYTPSE